jgi:uncharacterized membrane protein YfcA
MRLSVPVSAPRTSVWWTGLLIGVATGVFSGLLGIGGAAILIPGMVELLGLSQHRAHGTSLLVMIPTAALSAVVYALHHPLEWRLVILFSIASMIGAVIGARLMVRVPAPTLKRLFGLFLLLVALRMLIG